MTRAQNLPTPLVEGALGHPSDRTGPQAISPTEHSKVHPSDRTGPQAISPTKHSKVPWSGALEGPLRRDSFDIREHFYTFVGARKPAADPLLEVFSAQRDFGEALHESASSVDGFFVKPSSHYSKGRPKIGFTAILKALTFP